MTQQKGKQHTTDHPSQRAKHILKPIKRKKHPSQTTHHILRPIKETPTSNSEAHLSPPLGDRPLVEEREEFFALSREEEKAV